MTNKYLIYFYLAAGAIVLYFIANFLGLTKSKAESKASNLKEEATARDPEKETLSKQNAVIIADSIYESLKRSALDDNKKEAVRLLKNIQTEADFNLLFNAFGERQEYFMGIPTGKQNLAQFIQSNLKESQKTELKNFWKNTGLIITI